MGRRVTGLGWRLWCLFFPISICVLRLILLLRVCPGQLLIFAFASGASILPAAAARFPAPSRTLVPIHVVVLPISLHVGH